MRRSPRTRQGRRQSVEVVAAVTVDVVDVDAVAAEDAVVPEDEDAASKPGRKAERVTQKHAI
jgi:hypothetical protein